jgi:nucleoside-triphosphatase THEP1/general stress protein 26
MEPRRTSPLKGLVDRILAEVNSHKATHPVLLVGGIGSGKTSTGLRLLSLLRWSGVRVGGFLAPRVMEEDETVGYSLIDLTTNATHAFASLEPSDVSIGRFFVSEKDLATAHRAVTTALNEASVVFIDEVGRLELDGGGHASAVQQLLASKVVPILHARDALEATIASPVGVRTFWGIVDSLPYPLLVTLSEDGFPWPRPMHLVDRDANRLWFATSRASKKVSQIKVNPHVTVLFVDSVRFNYASIQGHARVVADPDRERTLWRDEWHDDWPNGPSDPDYVLLRVDGVRGHYLRGTTGEVGIVDLACSDAA